MPSPEVRALPATAVGQDLIDADHRLLVEHGQAQRERLTQLERLRNDIETASAGSAAPVDTERLVVPLRSWLLEHVL